MRKLNKQTNKNRLTKMRKLNKQTNKKQADKNKINDENSHVFQ